MEAFVEALNIPSQRDLILDRASSVKSNLEHEDPKAATDLTDQLAERELLPTSQSQQHTLKLLAKQKYLQSFMKITQDFGVAHCRQIIEEKKKYQLGML